MDGNILEYKLDLDIRADGLTAELVKKLKLNGITVNCWTVDDKEYAEKLVSWGVDYITTNILE